MSRFLKLSLSVLTASLLSACSLHTHDNDYIRKGSMGSPLQLPSGVDLKSAQNYYPVPGKANTAEKPPSLIPPDSHLNRYKKKARVTASNDSLQVSRVKWGLTPSNKAILLLQEKQSVAYHCIGKALRATNLQVLTQDPSMSSYYFLDTPSTKQQITEKTPLYRLYVKKEKDGTSSVELLADTNKLASAAVAKRILQSVQQHLA